MKVIHVLCEQTIVYMNLTLIRKRYMTTLNGERQTFINLRDWDYLVRCIISIVRYLSLEYTMQHFTISEG